MKRRLLSILLTFCIVMGILPTTVWADENMDRSQGAASMGAMTDPNLAVIDSGRLNTRISWSISADESTYILMLNGTGPLWDVDNGNKVPSIEHLPWYKYDQSIKQVIIGEGITRIWIENLQGYLDAKISRSISIPSTVTNINGPYNGPYNGTGTKHYGTHTFFKEFVVAAENSVFASKDGVLFSKDMTTLIAYPRDRDGTSYTIPDGTTSILKWAFYQCNLLDIIVPSSVNLVEDYAFDEANSLTKIELPDSITNIGSYAFSGCGNLVDVKLSNNITSILSSTFQFCESLTDITIPVGVTSIEGSAFNGCYNLKNVFIPNGINSIGQGAFRNCTSLDRISIPSSVTSLDPEAFINCKNLANIYYDGNKEDWLMIEYTAEHTSEDGNLYTIPFYGGKTTTALIHYNNAEPDDVDTQKINGTLRSGDSWQLLWECSWKEVDGAPTNGRVDITMTGAANRTDEIYIYNENSNQGFPWELAPHSIPKSAIKTLSISGESVGKRLRVAANSFQGYSNLETVLLDDVTGIDSYAFEGCSALKSVEFLYAAELTTIGKGAFKNCTSLSTIELPGNLEHIGDAAFQKTALETITLGRSITEIGADAFSGCRNVKIRCYENSVAHRYAQDNSIPFELINENLGNVNIYCGNGRIEPFDNTLEYYVSQTSSTVYNPKLSHMLIALSNAAYDVNNIKDSMKELGFSDSNIYCHYTPGDFSDVIAYAIAKKTLPSGKNLVLVTVRGSSSSLDWLSNFAIGNSVAGCFWHAGFESAVNEVYSDLSRIVANDFTNTTFVVTGHSRGAAVANLLEVKLFDAKVPTQNVYGYNFACPDVAAGLPIGWNWLGEHNNVFNIGNAPDPVSVVPGVFGSAFLSAIPGTTWGKFGQSRWFSKNWNNLSETTLDMSFSAHDQKAYLDYLSKEPAFNTFKTWAERKASILASQAQTLGKLFTACCPVDIIITDDNGKQIASVIGGEENYYDSAFGEVVIFRDGDKKAIFVQGSQPLNVRFTATDSGTMDYTVQTININSSDILSQKTFTNVSLEQGKQMLSMADVEAVTGVGVDVSKVPLYVLDSTGNPEKNVLPDGKGTEVPIDTPLECEHSYTANVTAPTCTERGYTTHTCTKCGDSYVDTYTAALGHSYGEWTVVTPATTTTNGLRERICARCSDRQTNVIPATGGGSSHDNPGSSSSDLTYRIDAPSKITGGTIKITPTSARENQRVTITVKPNTGYILEQLTATNNKGDALTLADKSDGKYTFMMPKGKVTVNAVFQPIEKPWSNPFQDITADMWCYNAVRFVSENDLMNGISSNLFAPNTNLSRAQLAQILYNKEGRPETEKAIFTDVPDGEWYSNAVAWAAEKGIVSGYGNGLFGPVDNITREQLAVMLWRYAGSPAATNKELHFADANEASSYALEALCWATENSIINGYGNGELAPKGESTRAQVAQMLMNYLNNSF